MNGYINSEEGVYDPYVFTTKLELRECNKETVEIIASVYKMGLGF